MENNNFNFNMEPGRKLKVFQCKKYNIDVSIITAYYNASDFIFQTANSILMQTFQNWEWIIVDDGSTDKETPDVLEKIKNLDERIKIFHQQNSGPAVARDYGIEKALGKYILILDADDLIDPTFLECSYWSMLSNPEATWSYSDQVGFGDKEYLWTQKFDVEKQKKENLLCICSLIKKDSIISVGGYSKTERTYHEDWKLWLQLLAKGYFPVKMNYFGFWYRNRNSGRLKTALSNPEKRQKALDIIAQLGENIPNNIKSIDYPNINKLQNRNLQIECPQYKIKTKKKNLLIVLPELNFEQDTEGILDLLKKVSQKYNIFIATCFQLEYPLRQKFEANSIAVYDMTSFIHPDLWETFINSIIKTYNIKLVVKEENNFHIAVSKVLDYNFLQKFNTNKKYKFISFAANNYRGFKCCISLQKVIKWLRNILSKSKVLKQIYRKVKKHE